MKRQQKRWSAVRAERLTHSCLRIYATNSLLSPEARKHVFEVEFRPIRRQTRMYKHDRWQEKGFSFYFCGAYQLRANRPCFRMVCKNSLFSNEADNNQWKCEHSSWTHLDCMESIRYFII